MKQRTWESIKDGERLIKIVDRVSFTRVAAAPAATLDWYPLHHDPEYAHAQGLRGIVMSTLQLMGLVDRSVTEWAGPATFIRRREIRLQHSVFANDVLSCTGHVSAKHSESDGDGSRGLVFVDVTIANADQVKCCIATVTISVPTESA